jgi:hypothetical protein
MHRKVLSVNYLLRETSSLRLESLKIECTPFAFAIQARQIELRNGGIVLPTARAGKRFPISSDPR